MADQRSLFEKYREPLVATDRRVATEDQPRLTGQNHTILAMLCERPHTNDELAAVSRKYTSRISDIRAAGYVGRVANGIPKRVDRLRCLGNAVVPQVAEWLGYRILELDRARSVH